MSRAVDDGLVGLAFMAMMVTALVAGENLDPDDMAALLTDLEASGGILTAADQALLALPVVSLRPGPRSSARGYWAVGVGLREDAGPRFQLRVEQRAPGWSFRLRARHDQLGHAITGWLSVERSAWGVRLGGGAPVHGAGLLAAATGTRTSLSTQASLTASRPGWRSTTTLDAGNGIWGGAVTWRKSRGGVEVGLARDRLGRPLDFLRAWVSSGGAHVAVLGLRRDGGDGLGVDLGWQRGPWRLMAEGAAWQRDRAARVEQAWLLAAACTRERWLAEFQATSSRAVAGLPGAVRPPSLTGWYGQGWALRAAGRPLAGWNASLVHGRGEDREPDEALGGRRRRMLLAVQLGGRTQGGPSWELRLRRVDESRWAWNQFEPWRPAERIAQRRRTWLALGVTVPLSVGQAGLTWRRLEETGAAREMLTVRWERWHGAVRWRAAAQMAWGDPLDLVAVSAPVSGLIRLRHWGHWQSGLWFGLQGRGRWRWQFGVEWRQPAYPPAAATALPAVGEVHAELGRRF